MKRTINLLPTDVSFYLDIMRSELVRTFEIEEILKIISFRRAYHHT